jgi:hypothetical protein
MNKKFIFLTFALGLTASHLFSQDVKYRRSSLHTMIVETEKFPNKDVVVGSFNKAPFPDKYNNHEVGVKSFDPNKYKLTQAEKSGLYKSSKMSKLANEAVQVDSASRELPYVIQKYFAKEKIANKMVAKWFNRQADGTFDDLLISERGVFNASFLDQKKAMSASDGIALLKTAGFELIDNTFVVVSKFNFVANEPAAAIIRDAAKAQANSIKIPTAQAAALKAADATYEKTKEGYSVWATSFLYKLVWNDSIAGVFYQDLWIDKSNPDPKKKEAFDNTELFKLEFVGDEKASSLVTFSLKEKRTEAQIIETATIRTIDAVYAKLQKKYDVFKTKTPLFTGEPPTAKIGLKEGIEDGDKFEVLEQVMDPKTGIVKYESKGKISVDGDMIWDNRYSDGAEPVVEGEKKPVLDRTTFKGGKKLYSGLLIKQIK